MIIPETNRTPNKSINIVLIQEAANFFSLINAQVFKVHLELIYTCLWKYYFFIQNPVYLKFWFWIG